MLDLDQFILTEHHDAVCAKGNAIVCGGIIGRDSAIPLPAEGEAHRAATLCRLRLGNGMEGTVEVTQRGTQDDLYLVHADLQQIGDILFGIQHQVPSLSVYRDLGNQESALQG